MLLEAILSRIYQDVVSNQRFRDIILLTNLLLDVHPNNREKPKDIYVWYSSKEACTWFRFEYTDESKNREMSFGEFYQYFTTVLGEEKQNG